MTTVYAYTVEYLDEAFSAFPRKTYKEIPSELEEYALVLSDANKVLLINPDFNAMHVQIPLDSEINFPVGSIIEGCNLGLDTDCYLDWREGLELLSPFGYLRVAGMGLRWKLEKLSEDRWFVSGDLIDNIHE